MIQAFIDLVKSNMRPEMKVCEVGVWRGSTSVGWLPIVRSTGGKGYLVDWFKGSLNCEGTHPYNPDGKMFEELLENLKSKNLLDSAIILHGESQRMAEYIPDNSLDIVFIDANHGYTHAVRDIRTYIPKVRPRGIIAGHDLDRWEDKIYSDEEYEKDHCDGLHPGVTKAVQELFDRAKVTLAGDTVWWLRREI